MGVPPEYFADGDTIRGPIADVNGTLYIVFERFGQPGAYKALLSWNEFRSGSGWVTNATFANGAVQAMAVRGTTLYIGGDFQGLYDALGNFVNANNVASLTQNGVWFPIGTGTPSPVSAITVDSAQRVYVGLDQSVGGTPPYVNMLQVFDTTSQQWQPVGGGLQVDDYGSASCPPNPPNPPPPAADHPGITAMTSVGTDIYIAGFFKQLGDGTIAYHVAKWRGSSQSWVSLAPSTYRDWCSFTVDTTPLISSIAVFGSSVFVGGSILPPCNVTYPVGLAEFSTNGVGLVASNTNNLWNTYNLDPSGLPTYGTGDGLCVLHCAMYVTGRFTKIGSSDGVGRGISALGIGRKINTS